MNKVFLYSTIGVVFVVIVCIIGVNTIPYFGLAQEENLEIGAIIPLTGALGDFGEEIQNGIDLAVDEINLKSNMKIKVVYEDSVGTNNGAVQAYNKLITDGIELVITSYGDTVLSVAPLAEQNKVIVFSAGGGSPLISSAGDYIFRNNILVQDEVKVISKYLINNGVKELGVVILNTQSGTSYFEGFKKEYENLGGKIIVAEKFVPDNVEYKEFILKMKDAQLKNMFIILSASQTMAMMKQSEELGMKFNYFAGYTIERSEVLKIPELDGAIYTHFFDLSNKKSKEYNNSFLEKYGNVPSGASALGYDVVYMLKLAYDNCGKLDTECIKNELYKIKDFDGASGKSTMNEDGDTVKEIIMKTIKDGAFVKQE
ncbi:MAG: penicillin-binding protein activator [Candidatus ainarchaeum sp.]|nr:penicillin-binding protein activator [Candidatus ainarchaeum sp.]